LVKEVADRVAFQGFQQFKQYVLTGNQWEVCKEYKGGRQGWSRRSNRCEQSGILCVLDVCVFVVVVAVVSVPV